MNSYPYKIFLTLSMLCLLLSACSHSPRTETIIMSSGDEVSSINQSSQPFQVQKIYRIPNHIPNTGQLLGWTSSHRIVAALNINRNIGQSTLEYLSSPYEKGEPIPNVDSTIFQIGLSPNGKYLYEYAPTTDHIRLTATSLQDGSKQEIVTLSTQNNAFVQYISWSNNGEYLIYTLGYYTNSQVKSVYIYNLQSQKLSKYQIQGLAKEDTLLSAEVSDDQHSVLLNVLRSQQSNSIHIILGTISGKEIIPKYERSSSINQNAWLNNNQFAFLGSDGTLYEYDQRNGELAIILEQVNNFKFSPDRKNIAYSLYDQNTMYVGKVLGKNIVYNNPVYRGIMATNIYWSQDNSSLLLVGPKPMYNTPFMQTDPGDQEAFVIELK